jgi:hypothetical protein
MEIKANFVKKLYINLSLRKKQNEKNFIIIVDYAIHRFV